MGHFKHLPAVIGLAGMLLSGSVFAQDVDTDQVVNAAKKFSNGYLWSKASVLKADFSCAGTVQYALMGTSTKEVAVAVFADGLDHAPSVLRFDADITQIAGSKIRLDDYSLTAEEIAGVAGEAPAGYRPSTSCHGVRLSDNSSSAAHIYWDHAHHRFDSWVQ